MIVNSFLCYHHATAWLNRQYEQLYALLRRGYRLNWPMCRRTGHCWSGQDLVSRFVCSPHARSFQCRGRPSTWSILCRGRRLCPAVLRQHAGTLTTAGFLRPTVLSILDAVGIIRWTEIFDALWRRRSIWRPWPWRVSHVVVGDVKLYIDWLIDWVRLGYGFRSQSTQKRSLGGDVLLSQSLGLVLKNYIKHNKSKHASITKYTTA